MLPIALLVLYCLFPAKDGSAGEGYDSGSRRIKHHTPLRQRLRQPSPAPALPSLPSAAATGTTSHSAAATNAGTWNVFGTAQWKYPLDLVVRSINELKQLEHFFATKVIENIEISEFWKMRQRDFLLSHPSHFLLLSLTWLLHLFLLSSSAV